MDQGCSVHVGSAGYLNWKQVLDREIYTDESLHLLAEKRKRYKHAGCLYLWSPMTCMNTLLRMSHDVCYADFRLFCKLPLEI